MRCRLQVGKKGAGLQKYRQMYVPPGVPLPQPDTEPLLVKSVYKHIQQLLTEQHAVLVDAGDSWFHAHKLAVSPAQPSPALAKLPELERFLPSPSSCLLQ